MRGGALRHRSNPDCQCRPCIVDRVDRGCDNPPRCAAAAARIVAKLKPKWNPWHPHTKDSLTLTKNRIEGNQVAREEGEKITFNPTVTDRSLVSGFRVFAEEWENGVRAVRPERPFAAEDEAVVVYTDGSCVDNGLATARAGSGIWFGEGDARNGSERVPGTDQSNQIAEMYAVTMAHRATPPFVPLHVVSDSKYVVDGLTRWLPKWEENGWIGVANQCQIKEVAALLRSRSAPTTFQWVKGHSRVRGNEEADRLAAEGAEKPAPFTPMHLPPPTRYLRQGASLACMTQRLAYRGIKQQQTRKLLQKTADALDQAIGKVQEMTGRQNTAQALWKAIRKDPIERRVRDFLWKTAHRAYKIGSFWSSIPAFEGRATCGVCGTEDSMEHILAECTAPGQARMWELAKELLRKRNVHLPESASLGLYLGSPLIDLKGEDDRARPGASRLTKIVLAETAHTIWKTRCERVIGWEGQGRLHDDAQIRGTWYAAMDRRLQLDQQMTKKALAGQRTMDKEVVLRTWAGVVERRGDLPEDWTQLAGVLVGRQVDSLEPHTAVPVLRA
ncbi:RnaseH-domain-containing protein [Cubamyces sp. BRFM 1775]|nr:RnaseH-domain-containing protein [Cubamyces sp. BRFM 1775]